MSTLKLTACLWRAHVSPVDGRGPEVAAFVTAGTWEAAMRKIAGTLALLEYREPEEVGQRVYNLTRALELIAQGVSEDHALRLFETGWCADRVLSWVEHPLVLLCDPAPLLRAWARIPRPSVPDGAP